MMKVALVGASGNAGQRLHAELVGRCHDVTAIARNPEKVQPLDRTRAMAGDIDAPEALAEVLSGHDAAISSVMFAAFDPEKLLQAVQSSGVPRYLVVGGAGSLEVAPLSIRVPDGDPSNFRRGVSTMTITTTQAEPERDVKPAVLKGLKERCPNCGEGKLFSRYLTVNDRCPECGEELHHHRADDGPAYLTILIVGHVMGFVLHATFGYLREDPLILALLLCTVATALSLLMLPRMKGMIVGYQWAKGMHGFGRPRG